MKNFFKLVILVIGILLIGWLCLPYNLLIIGSDARPWEEMKGTRADGLILVKVVPLLAKVDMISIPRDTYAEIPCEDNWKRDKITHSFAFGSVRDGKDGGRKCTIEAVENLLETKINYSVVFRFDDVINLTTLIGGVDIVANHTFTQDEQHFDEGKKYRISGERALAYTRHRKSDGAFERDGRQRQVMQEIIKKLVKPSGWKYIPRVYKYVNKRMEISANPIKALAVLPAILLKKDGITQKEITGDGKMMNGTYYFIPNEQSLEKAKEDFSMDFNLGF